VGFDVLVVELAWWLLECEQHQSTFAYWRSLNANYISSPWARLVRADLALVLVADADRDDAALPGRVVLAMGGLAPQAP
jgi:hypothetical protein